MQRSRVRSVKLFVPFLVAITAITFVPSLANASCAAMQNLAQESANSMAARDHMDHYWFSSHASQKGALAENSAIAKSKADAIAQWWGSPGHASNMRLSYTCKSVASAVSRSGRRYWAMVIGNSDEQRKASLQRKRDDHRKRSTVFSWGT
jgi:cysteine-rich secretory family protein